MRRGPICKCQRKTDFQLFLMKGKGLSGISTGFPVLSQSYRQVAHVLLTRPPLTQRKQASSKFARLACIRHAASVRPEPGSNSPRKLIRSFCYVGLVSLSNERFTNKKIIDVSALFSFQRTIL